MNSPFWRLNDYLPLMEFSQAILLVFILLVMKKNRRANLFFAGFLMILSLTLTLPRLEANSIRTAIAIVVVPGIALTGVFIYFYTMVVTGLLTKWRYSCLLHLVVYGMCLFVFTFAILMSPEASLKSTFFRRSILVVLIGGLGNSIVYILYTMVVLKKFYRKSENYYSDLDRVNLDWLMRLSSLALITMVCWCVATWVSFENIIFAEQLLRLSSVSMLIIIIFITAYQLINQPEVFKQNLEMNLTVDEAGLSAAAGKYAKQNIDEKMQDRYLEKLNSFMEEKRPYLDESITIKGLSGLVDIPSHHLSILINNRLNKNFYTFINEYRIRDAAAILNDPLNSDASIISVAFRVGFNSKSTFNSVFKKITGQTPSEYRKRAATGS